MSEKNALTSGGTGTGGWQWIIVLALLFLYILGDVATEVGGILLLSDLFKPSHPLPGSI